jgi:hypothetical protein
MELQISRGLVQFNTSQFGNTKQVLFVEFPNCISTSTGQSFKWMPTYAQLNQIKAALHEIELESWQK